MVRAGFGEHFLDRRQQRGEIERFPECAVGAQRAGQLEVEWGLVGEPTRHRDDAEVRMVAPQLFHGCDPFLVRHDNVGEHEVGGLDAKNPQAFVAVTSFWGAHNALYTSADGKDWTSQPNPFGDPNLFYLSSDGTRAVAVEEYEGPAGGSSGGVWVSSPDGTAWARYQLPLHDYDQVSWPAILGDHLVVTGANGAGTSVLWTTDLAQ